MIIFLFGIILSEFLMLGLKDLYTFIVIFHGKSLATYIEKIRHKKSKSRSKRFAHFTFEITFNSNCLTLLVFMYT